MATAYHNEPYVKQIININNEGLVLKLECLRQVLLHDEIKDKKVCVVSIAGAFRQGKSFLLNFFIRYLNIACKTRKNLTKWLRPEDGPIVGFSSRGGSDVVTSGILIWSEVFLTQLRSGEEIAVVLMDTQGSFDNETTVKNNAVIFALSTLISSVQIYNLKDNIKSSDLNNLQFFLGYGQLLRESGNQIPFQNLLFLIRDWATPEQFPFGIAGGKLLLEKILSTDEKSLSEEIISLRKDIKHLFENISCFLLPHPGLNVTKLKFSGKLEEIEESFKTNAEILASVIFSPENLVPKVINGQFIKVKHLVDLFKNYHEQFKNNDMPEIKSLFMATSNAQHMMAIEEAEAVYDAQMAFVKMEDLEGLEKCILLEEHHDSKNIAIQNFMKKKIIGNKEMHVESRRKLEERLDAKFIVYDNLNTAKLEKKMQEELTERVEQQQSEIVNLEDKISEEMKLRNELMEEHQRAVDAHKRDISDLQDQLNKERERMENLEEGQEELIEEQKRRISELEDRLDKEREYIQSLNRQTNGTSILQEIDNDNEPAAQVVKGVVTACYGVASVIVGTGRVLGNIFRN